MRYRPSRPRRRRSSQSRRPRPLPPPSPDKLDITDPPVDEHGNLDEDEFDEQLAAETSPGGSVTAAMDELGIPAGEQATIGMGAGLACQAFEPMGISDPEAIGYLMTDMEGQISTTEEQATRLWPVIKASC